jgi:DnaJ-class molecular chaperone
LIVLCNPERRAHYDRYGTVMDDDESEDAFFKTFEEMFG